MNSLKTIVVMSSGILFFIILGIVIYQDNNSLNKCENNIYNQFVSLGTVDKSGPSWAPKNSPGVINIDTKKLTLALKKGFDISKCDTLPIVYITDNSGGTKFNITNGILSIDKQIVKGLTYTIRVNKTIFWIKAI